MRWRGSAAPIVLAAALAGVPPLQPEDSRILIVNVHVVPMDRPRVLARRSVLISGESIESIAPAGDIPHSRATRVIPGEGLYLMPALADLHVHLTDEEMLPVYLANGITTIVNMNGNASILDLRDRIRAHEAEGPSIRTTGPLVAGAEVRWSNKVLARTPEEARQIIAEQAKAGYDFVKVYEGLEPATYAALLAAAREHGLRAIGHVPDRVDRPVFLRGQAAVHHAGSVAWGFLWPDLDLEALPSLAREFQRAGIAFVPTLALYEIFARRQVDLASLEARPEMRYVPARTRGWWSHVPESDDTSELFVFLGREIVKAMKDAGVRILVGTDHPNPHVIPGAAIHDELQALARAGLTPYEALVGATRAAGEFLDEPIGVVQQGYRADLLLLRANPLANLANLREIEGVVRRGRWHDIESIREGLEQVAAWAGAPKP